MVLSGAAQWTQSDGSQLPSGYWAEEVVVPHELFLRAGHVVDIATPGGVEPTADAKSFVADIAGPGVEHYARYLAGLSEALANPLVLSEVDLTRYDAVVVPGGHGPMEDLSHDAAMGSVLARADAAQKVLGLVCHGPAALLSARSEDAWPFAGRRVTGLTNNEEVEFGTAAKAPWLLQTRLTEWGAEFVAAENWSHHVVQDGNLITGQNPGSSADLAQAVIAHLQKSSSAPKTGSPE